MLEGDAAAADSQNFIIAREVADDHAAGGQRAERKGVQEKLGNGEQHQLENCKIIYLLEQDPLGDQENLVDEKNEKEEKERHDKREHILSSNVAIYNCKTSG